MSRNVIIAVVAAAVVLAGGGALLATRHNSDDTKTNTKTQTDTSSAPTSATPSEARGVNISNLAFSPANMTIPIGTTIVWTNKDSTAHTVTETDGQKGPDSGDLVKGDTYRFTYDTAGTFKYHCSIHPDMTGTVTVTE